MELIYLSLFMVAIAFAVVVVYLCIVLKRVSNTMKSLSSTLGEVEKQVNYITPQLSDTIKETDRTIDDAREKVEATDSLFDSVQGLGISLQNVNDVFHSRFGKMTDEEMDQKIKPFVEGIKWSEVGVKLYTTFQKNKPKDKNEVILRDNNEMIQVTGKEG